MGSCGDRGRVDGITAGIMLQRRNDSHAREHDCVNKRTRRTETNCRVRLLLNTYTDYGCRCSDLFGLERPGI